MLEQSFPADQLLGYVSFDRELMKLDREGRAPYDYYKDSGGRFYGEMKSIRDKVIELIESDGGAG